MQKHKHYISCLTMLLTMAGALVSCGTEDRPTPEQTPAVRLVISVGVNEPGGTDSRSAEGVTLMRAAGEYPEGHPYDFEPAATVYEGIRTLRVIVANGKSIVEGNKALSFTPHIPASGDLYGDLVFSVTDGDDKKVYVIANEESTGVDWTQYDEGTKIDPSVISDLQIAAAGGAGQPFIDNTGDTKTYLPLTEVFDVPIPNNPKGQSTVTHDRELFVTRGAVKFLFQAVKKDGAVPVEPIRVKEISITGLAASQFLFPNETTYLPGKNVFAGAAGYRKIITDYVCPEKVATGTYTFTPANFGLNASDGTTGYAQIFAPELYFPESPVPAKGYMLTAKVEVGGKEVTFGPTALPNLPSLPRNTFVKVDLSFLDREVTFDVVLMPYIGVWLNPTFGIDTDNNTQN